MNDLMSLLGGQFPGNSLANYQQGLYPNALQNNYLSQPENLYWLLQRPSPCAPYIVMDRCGNTVPEVQERASCLVERMAFWCAIPLLGHWIAGRLADELNDACDFLERVRDSDGSGEAGQTT